MSKMTIVQLGVLVLAICSSTQATSNSTVPTTSGTSTSNSNTTVTVATDTHSSSTNSTSATGAGVLLNPGTFSFLIPFIIAASFLQCYC